MEHLDVSLRNPRMNREFWTEFLQIYRSQHCLWNYKSKAYLNKTLRQRGYEKLLEFLRRGMPDATIETVKSKINTFRTNYRKQMKKLTASRLSSANGECDEYEPTLWYFNCLRFLSEPDTCGNGTTYETSGGDTDDFTPQQLVEIVQTDEDEVVEEEERSGLEIPSRCSTPFSHMSKVSDDLKPAKRRISAVVDVSDASASNVRKERSDTDECELLGKIWASKIRRLPENIRPFVEKQVNDIFFNVTVAINSGRSYPPEHSSTQTEHASLSSY